MSCLHSFNPHRHIQALYRDSILELDHDYCQHWMLAFLLLERSFRKLAFRCTSYLAIDQRRVLEHCAKWKGMGHTDSYASCSPTTRHHISVVPEDFLSYTNGCHNAEAAERSALCVRRI